MGIGNMLSPDVQQAKTAVHTAKYGSVLAKVTFSNMTTVVIYDRGFVRVSKMGLGGLVDPARLVSITSNVNVSKKTGVGRAASNVVIFGATAGLGHNITPNIRGDIYVTIMTDSGVQSVHVKSPQHSDVNAAYELEAAAQAAIASAQVRAPSHGEIAARESELNHLLEVREAERAERKAEKAERREASQAKLKESWAAQREWKKAADASPLPDTAARKRTIIAMYVILTIIAIPTLGTALLLAPLMHWAINTTWKRAVYMKQETTATPDGH